MTATKLTTASVLAFERNFDISDGVFFQINQNNNTIVPLLVTEKSIRGTISNRLKNAIASDPAKLDAEIEKANLQKVDVAMLDSDKDALIIEWSCKVLPFTGQPCVCNDINYQDKLVKTVQSYLKEHGVKELAKRYALNIINGRWLWRNRMAAETISLTISIPEQGKDKQLFTLDDVKDYSLQHFDVSNKSLEQLTALVEAGLLGKQFVIFKVRAQATMGNGQEVYPSQELVLDTAKEKSKVLYAKNKQAAMHSQKISNALRTIDTWYNDAEFPIAVEPYGAVTTMGHAFRQPKQKMDFYTLFDNWILKDEKPTVQQQHYIIAVLIRGGVFGASGKE